MNNTTGSFAFTGGTSASIENWGQIDVASGYAVLVSGNVGNMSFSATEEALIIVS